MSLTSFYLSSRFTSNVYPTEYYYTIDNAGQIPHIADACPSPDAVPGDACYEALRVRDFDSIFIL